MTVEELLALLQDKEMALNYIQQNQQLVVGITLAVVVATVLLLGSGLLSSDGKKKKPKGPIALNADSYIPFKLIEREEISHDTRRFRFALQSDHHVLGLPVGKHISLKFTDSNGKDVTRSYTPISSDDEIGYVDFVIKVYFSNVHPKFPQGGKMSQHLESLKIGDSILMRGPKGSLTYHGRGSFEITSRGKSKLKKVKQVGMVAGGTGITPMLQVVKAMTKDPRDSTVFHLIFANQTEEDILCRQELEEIARDHPDKFKLWYTLDRPGAEWKYSKGFINTDMCRAHLPANKPGTILLVCGPPPMIDYACKPAFKELGFSDDQIFAF